MNNDYCEAIYIQVFRSVGISVLGWNSASAVNSSRGSVRLLFSIPLQTGLVTGVDTTTGGVFAGRCRPYDGFEELIICRGAGVSLEITFERQQPGCC